MLLGDTYILYYKVCIARAAVNGSVCEDSLAEQSHAEYV